MTNTPIETLDTLVRCATDGDRDALESLLCAVQKDVFSLAMRFLWHPQDAEDATQEIMIRIMTGLSSFKGESSFRTWVYRVACNALLTQSKKRMEQTALSFEEFAEALAEGLSDESFADLHSTSAIDARLLDEVKIGCTLAMLMCLDREHRLTYILGEILDLDHREGAEALAISPAAFRKRLSRANTRIVSFMTGSCGLVDPTNACRCERRVGTAVARGCVNPETLLFVTSPTQAKHFPEVLQTIRQLEETRRVAALYRSHPQQQPSAKFMLWLATFLDGQSSASDSSKAAVEVFS